MKRTQQYTSSNMSSHVPQVIVVGGDARDTWPDLTWPGELVRGRWLASCWRLVISCLCSFLTYCSYLTSHVIKLGSRRFPFFVLYHCLIIISYFFIVFLPFVETIILGKATHSLTVHFLLIDVFLHHRRQLKSKTK